MNVPWFDANYWAWIPGTAFGVLGGLWGSIVGICAPRGKARQFVVGSWVFLMIASVLFLLAGTAGLLMGQPFAIWFFLMLPGFQGLLILGLLFPVVLKRYQEAEERRMESKNLTS